MYASSNTNNYQHLVNLISFHLSLQHLPFSWSVLQRHHVIPPANTSKYLSVCVHIYSIWVSVFLSVGLTFFLENHKAIILVSYIIFENFYVPYCGINILSPFVPIKIQASWHFIFLHICSLLLTYNSSSSPHPLFKLIFEDIESLRYPVGFPTFWIWLFASL